MKTVILETLKRASSVILGGICKVRTFFTDKTKA